MTRIRSEAEKRHWEMFCDEAPTKGQFPAREVMLRAGIPEGLVSGYLKKWQWLDGHKLVRVAHGIYEWDFGD